MVGGIFNKPIEDSRRNHEVIFGYLQPRKLGIVSLQCTKELSEIKLNISKMFLNNQENIVRKRF